ncbi:MAG TPA: sodium:solute symporter [Bryobacterales bacterium]|nr:sodium:solute symporter [Bryobacterales bacterium]
MPRRLPDLAVILVYLIAITAFGARFHRSQKSLKDYFLGGRTVAWWAIMLSIVAAETSTLTIIGTPALAYTGNLGFLQVVCGYLVARVVIAALFIPQYFRGEMYTAYELMRRRFGEGARRFTACTFLVVRALAEGVRVFAISIVISIVLGTGELTSIVIILLLTLFYTFKGGMTAVIWTDVVQMALYVAGGLLSFWLILARIPGGWAEVVRVAAPLGKFQIFDFRLELTREFFSRTYSFWAGLACGAFLATGTHGTDQLVVQRLLSARNERESKIALLASGVVIVFQFTLFLLIGVLLYVFHLQTGRPAPQPLDRVYPAFIWNYLPVGAAGVIVAAILAAAMSNLSAALNSLASTTIMDFYKPLFGAAGRGHGGHSEDHYLRLSRRATIVWGLVLLGIALLARHWGSVLEAGLAVISITIGALLGVFLLGVLTRRANQPGAIAGMMAGFATMVWLHFATHAAWTWYVVIVSSVTFSFGYLASLGFSPRAPQVPP